MAKRPLVKVSIDPGLGGTGFALWQNSSWGVLEPPIATGVLEARPDKRLVQLPWVNRAYAIGRDLDLLLQGVLPTECFVELPNFRPGAGGHMVAMKGDLGKLYFVCGVIAEVCRRHNCLYIPVGVPEWKGNMSKELVAKRVKDRLGIHACGELQIHTHAWDAVGLGLTMKGFM